MGVLEYLQKNHLAMMAVCCLLPAIVIFGLQFAGVREWWLYPLAVFICIGSHALMMAVPKKAGGEAKCH